MTNIKGMADNLECFTRATWRASKRRKMQKRIQPWGGRKTAPAAFLEAAKRTQIKPGRANRRICTATKRDGGHCGNIALKGLTVCGPHGRLQRMGVAGKASEDRAEARQQKQQEPKTQRPQKPLQ